MKKLILLAAALLSLTSCQNFMAMFIPEYPALPAGVATLAQAYEWISANTVYVSDQDAHGQVEYWQGPAETMERMTGDCEDFAILLASMAHVLGHDSGIVIGNAHSVAKIDGFLYDCGPVNGLSSKPFAPDDTEYDITYDEDITTVLERCYYKYGSR